MKSLHCTAMVPILALGLMLTLWPRTASACRNTEVSIPEDVQQSAPFDPNGACYVGYDPGLEAQDYSNLYFDAKDNDVTCARNAFGIFTRKLTNALDDAENGGLVCSVNNQLRNPFQAWLGGAKIAAIYVAANAFLDRNDQNMAVPDALMVRLREQVRPFASPQDLVCGGAGDNCTDDYAVTALGYAWIAAYEKRMNRTSEAAAWAARAVAEIHKTLQPMGENGSVCFYRNGLFPLRCDGDLSDLHAGTVRVIGANHGQETPAYGLGLMTSVASTCHALQLAGSQCPAFSSNELEIMRQLQFTAQQKILFDIGANPPEWTFKPNACITGAGDFVHCGEGNGNYTPFDMPIKRFFDAIGASTIPLTSAVTDVRRTPGGILYVPPPGPAFVFNDVIPSRYGHQRTDFFGPLRQLFYVEETFNVGTDVWPLPQPQAFTYWIQRAEDAGFGDPGTLTVAGGTIDTKGTASPAPVEMWWRNITTGSAWQAVPFQASPSPSGNPRNAWYNSVPAPVNPAQSYEVKVRQSGGPWQFCSYLGAAITWWCQPPVARFLATCDTSGVCSFTDEGSVPGGAIQRWTWDYGDGQLCDSAINSSCAGQAPPHAYPNGTFTVRLTVTDTGNRTASSGRRIYIGFNQPNLLITATPRPGDPRHYDFSADSGPNSPISSWVWSFGDGATGSGQPTDHLYTTSGTFVPQVVATDPSGQPNRAVQPILINLAPAASFTSSCPNRTCTFDASGSSDDIGVTSWAWSFGDGALGHGKVVSHTYSSNGTFTVQLTAGDAQSKRSSTSNSVTVTDPPPVATFTASCSARTCSFDGRGSTDDSGIISYAWTFGDGTTGSGATASHTYGSSGTFTVTLTVTDTSGQPNSTSSTVNLDLPPTASFTASCSARTCSFNASSSSDDFGIASYSWTFGDGTTGSGVTASHTYGSSGNFTVTLTVTDTSGQPNSTTRTVTPNLPPTASFTASCSGRTCSFNGSGSSDDVGVSSYAWSFGDGGTASGVTASRTYASSGTFTVTLTVTDTMGATNSTTRPVTPNLPPTASFTASCSARTCSFNGSGSSDDLGIVSYTWAFGDGGTGSGVTASHTYTSPAAVTVTLTVADGSGNTASASLIVHPDLPPTATFTVSCIGRSCNFSTTGSSDDLGITSYTWSFGDGSPAGSGAFPNHVYATNGTYTITLTVTDTAGQTAQTTRTASAVDNPPFASFWVGCNGLTCTAVAEGSTDDVGIVNYTWAWGDGQTTSGGSGVSTSSHTYASYATYTIGLTVRDVANQTASVSHGVSLSPYPVPVFTFNCVGRTCTVNATGTTGPSPITNYHWDWGDESTTDTAAVTAQHTFLWADAFQVTLMVTDSADLNGFVTHTRRVGMADSVGIFDRLDGKFHLRSAGINDKYLFFISAAAGNQPVAGDWNGDGVRTGGKFNDATGEFALSNSLSKTSQDLPVDLRLTLQAPGTGRVPIVGDWNGDGIESVGLYDPATQTFYLRNSLTTGPADITFTFTGAASGWRPIAGDWDQDGIDSVGLYDPATSTFYLRNLNTTGGAQITFVFGTPGTDRWPVAGDWVANGRSTIGLYLQSTHTFQLRNSNTAGAADSQFTTGTGVDTPPLAGYWYMP